MKIRSSHGDYEVKFVDDLVCRPEDVVVFDRQVFELHKFGYPECAIDHRIDDIMLVDAGEDLKTLPRVSMLIDALLMRQVTRKTHRIVAVGGGTVQDAVAMACLLYQRGLPWVYCPTTLLAMCDSCIGAKCGINHGSSKNLLGAYSAPSEVRICAKFLDTLPPTEMWSGWGEAWKLGWIGGSMLAQPLGDIRCRIGEALDIKQRFVEADEHEQGERIYLSYGHTLAHAIESVAPIPHGLAVVAGMRFANYVSMKLGLMDLVTYDKAHESLSVFPVKVPTDHEQLAQRMAVDKKADAKGVWMVTTSGPGQMARTHVSFYLISKFLREFVAQQ